MEQELRFGLTTFEAGFSYFHVQNFFLKNIVDGENIFGIELS